MTVCSCARSLSISRAVSDWRMKKSVSLTLAFSAAALCFFQSSLFAQRSRITAKIQNGDRVRLHGHLIPKTDSQNDTGSVDPDQIIPSVTLVLRPSAEQETDLE